MMKKKGIYIVALIILLVNTLLQSCEVSGIIIDEPEDVSYTATPENIEETEETKSMTVKPIIKYDNYFVEETNKVFGLLDTSLKLVEFKDADDKPLGNPAKFAYEDGMIFMQFFTVEQGEAVPDTEPVQYEAVEVEHNFSQFNGKVSTLAEWPVFAEPVQIEIKDDPFQIVSGLYEEIEISTVYNGSRATAFLPIVGAVLNDNGMWFNVSETFNAMTQAGLYFYAVDDTAGRHKLDKGRLW